MSPLPKSFSAPPASSIVRVQGAFISDDEVEKLVEFVKQESEAVYDEDVLEAVEKSGEEKTDSEGEEESGGDADPLLTKAIEIVVDAGQASVSLVQRRLSVGYSRAGRLIDQMEARGIIGPHEGSKPRRVLVTKAEYLAMLDGASLAGSGPDEPESPAPEEDIAPFDVAEEDDLIIPPAE